MFVIFPSDNHQLEVCIINIQEFMPVWSLPLCLDRFRKFDIFDFGVLSPTDVTTTCSSSWSQHLYIPSLYDQPWCSCSRDPPHGYSYGQFECSCCTCNKCLLPCCTCRKMTQHVTLVTLGSSAIISISAMIASKVTIPATVLTSTSSYHHNLHLHWDTHRQSDLHTQSHL